MKLILQEQMKKLQSNHEKHYKGVEGIRPVVKLFTPMRQCTWLISSIDPDGDTLFGLCDLGMGFPELGCVSLNELTSLRIYGIAGVERDKFFKPKKSLSEYADEARQKEMIVA